jgi:diguanylate cyclase (GGDEF)-like protein
MWSNRMRKLSILPSPSAFCKRVVLNARLELANRLENYKTRVSNPDTIEMPNRQLTPYDEIMDQPWFRETEAVRMPRLCDYLTIERAELVLGGAKHPERVYDEKFHILMAPALLLPDLDFYRLKCGMRDVPVVIAFMDIDKFKDFNSEKGESYIDLHLLPRFMATLEAHVYGRGYAYRFGGDEYTVLLPNADTATGLRILSEFQDRLKDLDYRGIARRTTVSMGMCEILPETSLTNAELLRRAEQAKNFAKKSGRNCIATYRDPYFEAPCVVQRAADVPDVTNC